jgi:cytidine deaminase
MPCLVSCAMQAYSPYTHCPSGVAFILRTGQVVAGCYLESAAHNPGLAPLQSAVVSGIIAGCLQSYDQVRALAMAEDCTDSMSMVASLAGAACIGAGAAPRPKC